MSKSPTYVDKKARNTQVGDLQVEPHRVIDAREQKRDDKYSTCGTRGPRSKNQNLMVSCLYFS